ncbi:MAG: hypothetical protein JSV49_08940 [Thermoplasmata archaeon]|nr:MAG: hypothetical protein JSV49_08940 [Thermoplasmata archaeon]
MILKRLSKRASKPLNLTSFDAEAETALLVAIKQLKLTCEWNPDEFLIF